MAPATDQRAELATIFEGFKSKMEEAKQERDRQGEELGETKQIIERMQDAMDEVEKKLSAVIALDSPAETAEEKKAREAAERKEAFMDWIRKGDDVGPESMKLLSRSDDTTGGFLATPEYVREIIKGVTEVSPLRELCRIRTTSNMSVQVPTRTGTFAAQWTSENATRTETTGLTYGLEDIPAHEMYAMVDITQINLEDSEFDLEGELDSEFIEQFGVTEGAGFITGTGAGQPEGILNNANISTVVSGAAAALTADGLIDLYFDLKTEYARNATFVLARTSIRDIRKLKDTQNQYLWQPGLAGLAPATILDAPYVEATDMPVVAAASTSIAFGDFRRGYTIVDRVSISMLRDPFTQAASGAVRFWARRRVGGQTVLAEAIKLQLTST